MAVMRDQPEAIRDHDCRDPGKPADVPPGYKRTEVGVIPNDWGFSALGSLLAEPPRYGINAPAIRLDASLPTYIRITDIGDDGRFRATPRVSVNGTQIARYFLRSGDLVFARTGASVGKSYLYDPRDGPLVFAGFLIRIAPDASRLRPEYVAYYAQTRSYWVWVANNSARTGQPGINSRQYGSLRIPLPPLPEQRAIAKVLSDLDELIGSLEALIAKKRAIKQATMQDLLTGRTRLPRFGSEWETKRMDDVAVVTMGQSPPSASYNEVEDGLPLIQGKADIVGRTTTDRIWTTRPSKRCDAGDLVLTVRAPVGSIARASRDACLGRGVCGLKPLVDSLFLFYSLVLRESHWEYIEQGSTFTAANSDQVAGFRIDVPTDQLEQQAIGIVLSDVDDEIVALERRLDKTRAIKQGAMQQLLTGSIRLPIADDGAYEGGAGRAPSPCHTRRGRTGTLARPPARETGP